jgi:hypothetical protein
MTDDRKTCRLGLHYIKIDLLPGGAAIARSRET